MVEESSVQRAPISPAERPPQRPDSEGELSEAALEAVVGGLTVEAGLARAAGFDLDLRLPAN